jgi:hypothetical protein
MELEISCKTREFIPICPLLCPFDLGFRGDLARFTPSALRDSRHFRMWMHCAGEHGANHNQALRIVVVDKPVDILCGKAHGNWGKLACRRATGRRQILLRSCGSLPPVLQMRGPCDS